MDTYTAIDQVLACDLEQGDTIKIVDQFVFVLTVEDHGDSVLVSIEDDDDMLFFKWDERVTLYALDYSDVDL